MTLKILVLAANPQDTAQLLLNKEVREIEDALERGKYRESFILRRKDAVRVGDLQSSLQKESARIVHFCGHGMGSQGLVLETSSGQQQLLDTQAIADLFKLFKNQIECVVLNACYSQVQAAEISKHINYVIGTNRSIRDDAAIFFSSGFYQALSNGYTIEEAFEFGKNLIQLKIYRSQSRERKLVPIITETGTEKEMPEHEVLELLIKEPLNEIITARQNLITRWNIAPRRWKLTILACSSFLLIGWAILHKSYGFMATKFNQDGVSHYKANRLDSALSDYQRAISLNPNFTEAHYHLGLLYEDLQKMTEAKTEYQLAIENGCDSQEDSCDSQESLVMLRARNNLGRLNILEKKYDLAIPPLLEAHNALDEEQVEASEEYKKLRYTVLKNLGWAQLGIENTIEAEIRLKEAIALFDQKAPAYCLLAQTYEKQEKQEQALENWRKCRTLANTGNPDEYKWLSIAREQLSNSTKMP